MKTYANYAWDRAEELLAIDSPTGFTKNAAIWVQRARTWAMMPASPTRAVSSPIWAVPRATTGSCSAPTRTPSAAWSPGSRATAA